MDSLQRNPILRDLLRKLIKVKPRCQDSCRYSVELAQERLQHVLQPVKPKTVGTQLVPRAPDAGDVAAGFDGCPAVFSLALFLWGTFSTLK